MKRLQSLLRTVDRNDVESWLYRPFTAGPGGFSVYQWARWPNSGPDPKPRASIREFVSGLGLTATCSAEPVLREVPQREVTHVGTGARRS